MAPSMNSKAEGRGQKAKAEGLVLVHRQQLQFETSQECQQNLLPNSSELRLFY
jgi:hypothetical protein